MTRKNIVHLLSGGLDSTVLLKILLGQGHTVQCLLVNYGQAHSKELWFAEHSCKRWNVPFKIIDLPNLGGLNDDNWIVPNRNCILLSLAVNLAVQSKADTVTIGCNKDDESAFPDCRQAFIQMFNTTMTTAEVSVEVWAPFLDLPKWKIAGLAMEFGVASEDFWTCYRGDAKPCGACPACEKLEAALKGNPNVLRQQRVPV